jgi:hypothetical protein
LEQGDALVRLLFNIALEWIIRRVQERRGELEWNGTRQHLVIISRVNTYHKERKGCKFCNVLGRDLNAEKTKWRLCKENYALKIFISEIGSDTRVYRQFLIICICLCVFSVASVS